MFFLATGEEVLFYPCFKFKVNEAQRNDSMWVTPWFIDGEPEHRIMSWSPYQESRHLSPWQRSEGLLHPPAAARKRRLPAGSPEHTAQAAQHILKQLPGAPGCQTVIAKRLLMI